MHLTGSELTGASSVVAALAIIGGYLGVRSANRNALKIAREERESNQRVELDALKRATYSEYISSLNILMSITTNVLTTKTLSGSSFTGRAAVRQYFDANAAAFNAYSQVRLLASGSVISKATEALTAARGEDRYYYAKVLTELQIKMRQELSHTPIPFL